MSNDNGATLMDAPTLPARVAPPPVLANAAEPTIGMILQSAVERGMDPAGMEKLAAIYERELVRRADVAFNEAMVAFHEECPSIVKNRVVKKGDSVLYRYVDFEQLTRLVRPLLLKHGFRYSFDTEVSGDKTTIVCHMRHVGGGRDSSRFAAKGTGTSLMSAAQIEASVTTFGQRRTLLAVLGLSVDDDDDGRGAEPLPQPPPDPAAPKVATRAERAAPADPSRVSAADLNGLLTRHREWTRNPHSGPTELAE